MHTQGGIAHQRDVNQPHAVVLLVLIEASIVLREARAVADRLSDRHMMKKPMRPPRAGAGQAIGRQSEDRTLKIVFGIPIPQPTAEEHGKNGLDIALEEL